MQTQLNKEAIKARIAEKRQEFERLSRRCNSFIRISPETIQAYKKEIAELETQLK
jgi:hypothetical protein